MLARLWRVAWVGGKREANEEAKLENEENKLGKHVQCLLLTLTSLLDAPPGVEESLVKL